MSWTKTPTRAITFLRIVISAGLLLAVLPGGANPVDAQSVAPVSPYLTPNATGDGSAPRASDPVRALGVPEQDVAWWGDGEIGLPGLGDIPVERSSPESIDKTSKDPSTAPASLASDPFQNDTIELVGHIGGKIREVEVVGNYAYVAQGASLSILDVSDKQSPSRVGYIVFGDDVFDVEVQGSYAYVANGNEGLRVVDVSDTSLPIEVGSWVSSTLYADRIDVAGSWAYVGHGPTHTISVADESDPALIEMAYYHWNSFVVDGGYVYYIDRWWAQADHLTIESLSSDEGGYGTPAGATDIAVAGDYVYLVDSSTNSDWGEFSVYSAHDKTEPTRVSQVELPCGAYGVEVSGDYAYVSTISCGMYIFSIVDKENPAQVAIYSDSWGTIHEVADGYAYYVPERPYSLEIISVSSPQSPSLAGAYFTPGYVTDVAIDGEAAYVADESKMTVVSLANPSMPAPVAQYALEAPNMSPVAVAVSAGICYLGSGGVDPDLYDLRTISVQDPSLPQELGSSEPWTVSRPVGPANGGDLFLRGAYAFARVHDRGVDVVDVADPSSPEWIGRLSNRVNDSDLNSQYMHLVTRDYSYHTFLETYDISDSANPTLITSTMTMSYTVSIAVSNGYAYLGQFGESGAPGTVQVLDVTDPYSSTDAGAVGVVGDLPADVAILGDHLFVGTRDQGHGADYLQVFDISSPSHPVLLATIHLGFGDGIRKIAVTGDYVSVLYGESGLFLFRDSGEPPPPPDTDFQPGTDGYSFDNNGAHTSWDIFRDTFGGENVEWNVAGLRIKKPAALAYYDDWYKCDSLIPDGLGLCAETGARGVCSAMAASGSDSLFRPICCRSCPARRAIAPSRGTRSRRARIASCRSSSPTRIPCHNSNSVMVEIAPVDPPSRISSK